MKYSKIRQVNQRLWYCPDRMIIALNGGNVTESSRPVGSRRFTAILLIVALSALFFSVRIDSTETLVTNDEPFWLGRSANFSRAIGQWDPEDTYQMAHPGVPVMWAGAVAFWINGSEYSEHYTDNTDFPFFIDERLVAAGIDPLEMLQHARVIKLGLETVIFAISTALVIAIGSRLLAAMTGVLIALDPFLAGFGPLLHVDSLLAMSLFAASLAIAWAMQDPDRRSRWLVAGILEAIAVLTRSTAAAIGIPLAVAWLMAWRKSGRAISVQAAGVWIAGFAATYILSWPVLWVDPVGTARAMIDWTLGAASGGHEHQLFFNGEITFDDPGWLFYPVTMLWRTTPVAWLGLGLFLLSLRSQSVRERIRPFAPVLLMAAVYLVVMSLGAKKFDRYVLPVYPVISMIAAFGFDSAIRFIATRLPRLKQIVPAAGLAAVAVFSLIPLANSGPYHLNYYNEIMRLFERPENAIQIGWGEGGSEVITFLESESDRLGRPVVAQTFSIPQESVPPPLKYFLIDDAEQTDRIRFNNVGLTNPDDWNDTDYYVFNIQQTQRGMVDDYVLFADAEPVHSVKLGGVVIWEIYAPNQLPVPEAISGD